MKVERNVCFALMPHWQVYSDNISLHLSEEIDKAVFESMMVSFPEGWAGMKYYRTCSQCERWKQCKPMRIPGVPPSYLE